MRPPLCEGAERDHHPSPGPHEIESKLTRLTLGGKDKYLKTGTGKASMDSTARSSYVSTLPSKGTGKGETWEHTQSPEHRGHISVRETNFESDATLRISFSMWRVLNKSNSTAGDSMGDGCTIAPGVSAGSGEGSGGQTIGSAGRVTSVLPGRCGGDCLPLRAGAHLRAGVLLGRCVWWR